MFKQSYVFNNQICFVEIIPQLDDRTATICLIAICCPDRRVDHHFDSNMPHCLIQAY